MDFNGIVAEVLRKTKRPDKLDMIRQQVNAAALFFSSEYDYDGDLIEIVRSAEAPATVSSEFIIPVSSLTRLRSIDYIKIAGTRKYVEKLDSRKLDACTDFRDKWYRAGANINVKLAHEAAALDISYFAFPPVLTPELPNYWMLQGNWIAIMEYAASMIFNDIGDSASSDRAMRAALAAGQVFKSSHVRSDA
jgi:hypothetical protein